MACVAFVLGLLGPSLGWVLAVRREVAFRRVAEARIRSEVCRRLAAEVAQLDAEGAISVVACRCGGASESSA